jgi:hypothetical protein
MTEQGATELKIELTAADNSYAYEIFQNFHIGDQPGYELHIDKGTGNAGNKRKTHITLIFFCCNLIKKYANNFGYIC